MTTEFKTMEQLGAEIRRLHQRVAELETQKSGHELILEAYRQSEAKFKSVAENSDAGVCIIQDGIVKYVNPKMAAIFGYTVDELVDNVNAKTLVLPEDWSMVEENIRRPNLWTGGGDKLPIQGNNEGWRDHKCRDLLFPR